MKKKYDKETLKMIWDMICVEKMMMKEVAALFNITTAQVNEMYQAATRVIGPAPRKNAAIDPDAPKKGPIKRPPALYSNHSPYRIAQPGIIR
jgi:hypothetical protein